MQVQFDPPIVLITLPSVIGTLYALCEKRLVWRENIEQAAQFTFMYDGNHRFLQGFLFLSFFLLSSQELLRAVKSWNVDGQSSTPSKGRA